MEGSKSEAIFESLNLSPQLFINEVLNIVDEVLDEAFDHFLQEASTLLKTEGTDRSEELIKGVAYIRELIQSAVDQRMQKWETYILHFCFSVPEEFSLPKAGKWCLAALPLQCLQNGTKCSFWDCSPLILVEVSSCCYSSCKHDDSIRLSHDLIFLKYLSKLSFYNESSGDELPDLDALTDTELDAQLKSLRDKLALVGKESAELNRELRTLERQSLSSSHSAGLIDEEAFELYKKHDTTEMFQELINMASEFRPRLGNLKRRREEFQSGDVLRKNHQNGLFNAAIEELQEFLDEIATT